MVASIVSCHLVGSSFTKIFQRSLKVNHERGNIFCFLKQPSIGGNVVESLKPPPFSFLEIKTLCNLEHPVSHSIFDHARKCRMMPPYHNTIDNHHYHSNPLHSIRTQYTFRPILYVFCSHAFCINVFIR